jgi:GH35 family endo-1,4-beta-xylanase
LVVSIAALAAVPSGASAQSGPDFPIYGEDKWLGNINTFTQAQFLLYFNQVTPENAGKWGVAAGTTRTGAMRWTQLDQAYSFAETNELPFNFHVLLWANQQPTWMATLPPADQLEEIKKWFAAVAARYPNIEWLQVVNEATWDPPDGSVPKNAGTNFDSAATTCRRSVARTAPTARATTGSSTHSGSRSSTSRTPS